MHRLILFLVLVFVAFPAAADFKNPPLTGDMVKLRVLPEPTHLPEILLSRSGKGLTYLSEFRGGVVLLNIWAMWCPPCIDELPSLNALQHAMQSDDFQVVTVSIDQSDPEKIKNFMEEKGWDKLPPFVDANGDIQKMSLLRNVAGVPITIILDRRLRAVAIFEGDADWNGRSARAVIDYYLENLPSRYQIITGH